MENIVTLNTIGDLGFVGQVANNIKITEGKIFSDDIIIKLNDCNILSANFEFPFSHNKVPYAFEVKSDIYNDLENEIALKGINWTLFNIANNHILDFGDEGIKTTKEILKKYALEVIGAGMNNIEAKRYFIHNINGIAFAFLNYVKKGFYISNHNKPGANLIDYDEICNDIYKLKQEKVNHIIVNFHWGVEYSSYPFPDDIELAHKLIDKGVSLIVGHHPHTLQGIEEYNGGIIAYSLGNFLMDMDIDLPPSDDALIRGYWTGILKVNFNKNKVTDYEFEPMMINADMNVCFPSNEEKNKIQEYMQYISTNLNSKYFYKDAFKNLKYREMNSWINHFKRNPFIALYKFLSTIKIRHFKILFGYLIYKFKK